MPHGCSRRRRLLGRRAERYGVSIVTDINHSRLQLQHAGSGVGINPELWRRRGPPYLSGRLDECGRAQTGAAGRGGPLRPLQQDPGSGNVAPGHPEARLRLPADAPRHVVGHLKRKPRLRITLSVLNPRVGAASSPERRR